VDSILDGLITASCHRKDDPVKGHNRTKTARLNALHAFSDLSSQKIETETAGGADCTARTRSQLRANRSAVEGLFSLRDTTKTTASSGFDVHLGADGEFAGWQTWSNDCFFVHTGPFWQRQELDGSIRCAFRIEKKHLNGTDTVHGGCLMTFADYCLFAIASPMLEGPAVTANFAANFIDTAHEGDLIVGTGEIIRAGASLIFVRGQLMAGERILFTFSATMKRLKRAAIPQQSV